MVNIILNGKDKIFYAKCPHCATDFTYQLEDAKEEPEKLPFGTDKTIECPECGEDQFATLLTKEEYEKMKYFPITYNWCAV